MLRYGGWEASIRPEIGGSLASLTHDGKDVLRPMPDDATDPLQAACFPLVPYCKPHPRWSVQVRSSRGSPAA